jgi:hypothetical protein
VVKTVLLTPWDIPRRPLPGPGKKFVIHARDYCFYNLGR